MHKIIVVAVDGTPLPGGLVYESTVVRTMRDTLLAWVEQHGFFENSVGCVVVDPEGARFCVEILKEEIDDLITISLVALNDETARVLSEQYVN